MVHFPPPPCKRTVERKGRGLVFLILEWYVNGSVLWERVFFFFFAFLFLNDVALPDLAADLSFVLNVDDKGTGGKRVEVDDLDLWLELSRWPNFGPKRRLRIGCSALILRLMTSSNVGWGWSSDVNQDFTGWRVIRSQHIQLLVAPLYVKPHFQCTRGRNASSWR